MLTEQDKAVLAHLVENSDAWIARALADSRFGPETVLAKCRRDVHVIAYNVAKDAKDYKPRGPVPSDETCKAVADAFATAEQVKQDAAAAKAAQQDRINNLFT
jgi:hypothetical protein